jgi:uncharacterized membrane protein
MKSKKIVGFAIATAAAGLFAASATNTVMAAQHMKEVAKVHCTGGNSCKGQSSCQSASNSCKGQNSCKGKGWVETSSAKECADKGGKVEEKKG